MSFVEKFEPRLAWTTLQSQLPLPNVFLKSYIFRPGDYGLYHNNHQSQLETDEGIFGWGEPIVEGKAATVCTAVDEILFHFR